MTLTRDVKFETKNAKVGGIVTVRVVIIRIQRIRDESWEITDEEILVKELTFRNEDDDRNSWFRITGLTLEALIPWRRIQKWRTINQKHFSLSISLFNSFSLLTTEIPFSIYRDSIITITKLLSTALIKRNHNRIQFKITLEVQ